jgi:NAD(P)H-hydrate epimerase
MLLYSPESVYQLDKAAVARDGFTEIELMQRAGQSVWRALLERWPGVEMISVFAGSGNNGGDAFVVALCARQQGIDVQLLIQGDLSRQSDTSRHFRELWQQDGGSFEDWQGQQLHGDVIVDGLLGIGLQRELNAEWQELINTINAHPSPRVAIDIPSGFIGAKTGQFLADGPDYCGELLFEDLGASAAARADIAAQLEVVESCQLPALRKKNSHKNHYGNLLIIGGDQGMSGAVTLAARAALRSGAGLVTALVHPECRGNLAAFPEVMVLGWDALEAKLPQASVIVVGPGLGQSDAAQKMLQRLQQVRLPMVVDAGALSADFLQALDSEQVVITPHPGEAAALLSTTSAQVQADRLAASARLAEDFAATCVLKGSGTLISQRGMPTAINVHGNPGMASAGMGDVLSGIVAAFIGQGLPPFAAARSAVLIHALCAERFGAEQDQIGLIAGDIIDRIPQVIGQLRAAD